MKAGATKFVPVLSSHTDSSPLMVLPPRLYSVLEWLPCHLATRSVLRHVETSITSAPLSMLEERPRDCIRRFPLWSEFRWPRRSCDPSARPGRISGGAANKQASSAVPQLPFVYADHEDASSSRSRPRCKCEDSASLISGMEFAPHRATGSNEPRLSRSPGVTIPRPES